MRGLLLGLALTALLAGAATADDTATPPEAGPDAFKLGLSADHDGCQPADALAEDPRQAYFQHLQDRLAREVLVCATAPEEAAQKLAEGELDLAFTRVAGPAPAPDTVRPILSWRYNDEIPRTEVVVVARDDVDAPAARSEMALIAYAPEELRRLVAFRDEAASDAQAVTETASAFAVAQGLEWDTDARNVPLTEALQALRDSEAAPQIVTHIGRYRVHCQMKAEDCEGTHEVWRGFIPIQDAFAVRADLPNELIYRLIGIHVRMHHFHPDAFATIAPGSASNLEPTEPGAFHGK